MNDQENQDSRSGAGGLGGLGAELTRLARHDPDAFARRVAQLTVREQAELALRLPARRRLDFLMNAPKPMHLVRALPDSELYLTVREVGPTDAVPLLELASAQQTRHLFDLESWRGDRFDAERAGAWVALLTEAGEQTIRRFLRQVDDEELALLFARWVRVEQLEYEDSPDQHGHGHGDAGTEEGWMTPDGYHRFSPTTPEHVGAIRTLLDVMFREQPRRYQRLLWASRWELAAELEEQAFHWRQSRLEEHGFPRLEQAIEIYAPPRSTSARPEMPVLDPESLAAPRAVLRVAPRRAALVPAIDLLDDDARERALQELVSVANCVMVADLVDTGDPEAHVAAMSRAVAYTEIGARLEGATSPEDLARLLREKPVAELFRRGWARAVELQDRARRLLGRGWAAGLDQPLEVLDFPVGERISALLEPRPRYYDIDGSRDFRTVAELEEIGVSLEVATLFGRVVVDVFGAPAVAAARLAAGSRESGPLFSSFLLTATAWSVLNATLRCDPLPEDAVAAFLRGVASRRTAAPEAPQRAFDGLVVRLVEAARLDARETSVLQAFGRYCLRQLAEECGGLDPGVPVERDAIRCLLLERR